VAKNKIPGPLERRLLIEKSMPEAQALRIAEAYLEAGRSVEAVSFLQKAGAQDRLAELRELAVREGDAFLFRSAAEACEKAMGRDEWAALAVAAEQAGKDCYAVEARRQAERGES